jgi:AraC family transcriptional regulator
MIRQRIMIVSDGARRPLFETSPAGVPSPSHSLLIEAHCGQRGAVQTRRIPDQVLTLFVDQGFVEHAADGGAPVGMVLPAGTVVLSLRDRVETVLWVEPARVMCVRIDDHVLGEAAATLGLSNAPALTPSSGLHDPKLTALMQTLQLEQAGGFPSGPLFVDGIEQSIVSLLVGAYMCGGGHIRGPVGGLPRRKAQRVEEFVRENLSRPLGLVDLANSAGYSASHFSWLFHQTFRMTPHRYLQRMRIERAALLLSKEESNSILDVALECGFQTQQHFSRVFRGVMGVSPGEYRRRP